jgi:hypothetical protein
MFRCVQSGGARSFVMLGLVGGVVTYLHSLTPALLALPAFGALLETIDRPRRAAALIASFAAIFLIALGWFGPIVETLDLAVHFSNWWNTPAGFFPAVKELFSARLNLPPLIVLAIMFYGVATIRLSRWCKLSLSASALIFFVLGYFGSSIPKVDLLEPARFEPAFYYFATPFVAVGLLALWRRFGRLPRWLRYLSRSLALIAIVFYAWIPFFLVEYDLLNHGAMMVELPNQADELERWIAESDPDSRMILESGWTMRKSQLILPYFGADLSLLWAIENGRELIGGSPSEGFSIYRFTDLGNGIAFGRALEDWPPDQFIKQLELYNIGSAILWTPRAKQYFANLPGVHLLEQSDPFELYGVSGTRTFLINGRAASIRAYEDCIQVRGAQPGRLVLKYHYFRTLRTQPKLAMQPTTAGNGDPVPFIEIVNDAARDIIVYNAGFLGLDHPSCARSSF